MEVSEDESRAGWSGFAVVLGCGCGVAQRAGLTWCPRAHPAEHLGLLLEHSLQNSVCILALSCCPRMSFSSGRFCPVVFLAPFIPRGVLVAS